MQKEQVKVLMMREVLVKVSVTNTYTDVGTRHLKSFVYTSNSFLAIRDGHRTRCKVSVVSLTVQGKFVEHRLEPAPVRPKTDR